MNGDHVAAGKQGMKIVALVHAGALHRVAIDEGVVADDVHPETGSGDARDVAADPADAHETERLAGEVRRQPARRRPSPAARLHFPLQRLEVSRKRKHQRDGAFGDRLLRVFRHVDDRDAPAPCRLDVDRVDADAVLDDALQPWRAIDDLRGDLRVAHQQQIGIAQFVREAVARCRIGQNDEINAGFPEHAIDVRQLELAIGANDLRHAVRPRPRLPSR